MYTVFLLHFKEMKSVIRYLMLTINVSGLLLCEAKDCKIKFRNFSFTLLKHIFFNMYILFKNRFEKNIKE